MCYGCVYGEHPIVVGSLSPNPWGLYDMHGNVWEWCLDCYTADLGMTAVTDPKGPAQGAYRVERGGAFGIKAGDCRSASRIRSNPSSTGISSGFRLALPLSE